MIAIIDYDAGNLKSVEKALKYLGEESVITRDKDIILNADRVILPGVGAFADAMEKLHKYDLVDVIHEVIAKGTPFIGICLGLQLLFESSDEAPGVQGLSVFKGKIKLIPKEEGLKIPHMGWNSLKVTPGAKLLRGFQIYLMYILYIHIILKQMMRILWRRLQSMEYISMLQLRRITYLPASSILRRVERSDLLF